MNLFGLGAAYIRVQLFELVDQALRLQKIKRSIDGSRRNTAAPGR